MKSWNSRNGFRTVLLTLLLTFAAFSWIASVAVRAQEGEAAADEFEFDIPEEVQADAADDNTQPEPAVEDAEQPEAEEVDTDLEAELEQLFGEDVDEVEAEDAEQAEQVEEEIDAPEIEQAQESAETAAEEDEPVQDADVPDISPEVSEQISEEAQKDVEAQYEEQAKEQVAEPGVDVAPEQRPAAVTYVEPKPEELEANERVRRRELELMAEHYVNNALKAYRKSEFREAAQNYEAALQKLRQASLSEPRILRKIESVQDLLYNLHIDWAEALAEDADRLANAEMFDQAIERSREAAEYDPTKQEEVDKRVKRFLELKRQAEIRDLTREDVVDVDKYEREFEINVLLEQGEVFYKNGRYTDARDHFEQVLLKDPYDVRAIRFLRDIAKRLQEVAKEKKKTIVDTRIAEVEWKWAEPVTPLLAGPAARMTGEAVEKTDGEAGIRNKLDSIVIPHIEFDEVPIRDVINVLKQRSIDLDPEGEGVNIILRLDAGAADVGAQPADAGAPQDEFGPDFGAGGGDFGGDDFGGGGGDFGDGDFGDGGGDFGGGGAGEMGEFEDFAGFMEPGADTAGAPGAAASVAERTITMEMDNIPLQEVIRYIAMLARLKVRIERHAVIMADERLPLETMETRFYAVKAGVLDAVKTRRARALSFGDDDDDDDDGGGWSDDDDDDDDDDGGGTSQATGNLYEFFSNFGVAFPRGSRVSYYQRTGKLVVHNTPENLRKIENVLREINITPTQVTIEAKFVEIVQNNLETLGFSWILQNGATYVPGTDMDGHFIDGDPKVDFGDDFQVGVKKETRLTRGIRFASDFLPGVESGADQILDTYTILGDVAFQTIVHALEQEGQADILSSPRVTTLSGNTAVLRMVTERYFPDQWTEPEVTAGSETQGASFKPSIAEFDEARDIGVILEVTPTVAADGYSIDLDLRPQVIDFVDYDDSFNYTLIINGESVEAKQLMPILSARTVETKVIVWDGETVVLGGMIGERIRKWEDKVPLLGDIPLLGRLFRASGEQNEKTNLLIFVTARLVNPAGLPIRANEIRGLPDFRH